MSEKWAEYIKARILAAIEADDISALCSIFHRLVPHAASIDDRLRATSGESSFTCVEGLAIECKWYDEEELVQASRRFLVAIDKRRQQRGTSSEKTLAQTASKQQLQLLINSKSFP